MEKYKVSDYVYDSVKAAIYYKERFNKKSGGFMTIID